MSKIKNSSLPAANPKRHNKSKSSNSSRSLKVLKSLTSETKAATEKEVLRLEYSFDHGINFKDRIIQITGEIERGDFNRIDAALSEMERNSKKAITIRINSPGGEVYEALAIIGRLRASKCQIITEAYGMVMSAATIILACGDKRRMSQHTIFMHHEASYGVSGTHSDVREEIEQMEREEELWCAWMADFSSKDKAFWRKSAKKKNFYMTAQECLSVGVIEEVL